MSSKKRRLARGVALALAVLLMLPVRTLATTIDEVQNRQEELKQENEDLQAKIDALKEDEEAALAYQKIDQARATIEEMNGKIKELEARISLSEEKYQGTIDAFKERLKALYVSGGSSLGALEILLDSESLSEFFTRQELVEVMAQRDQSMLDQLDAYMEETQGDREELVAAQQEVADSKKAIEAAQDELEVLYEENDLLVASLEGQQAQAQEQIAANEAEDAELQAQLEALIAERNRQEEEKRQQALQNQQAQNGGSDGGEGATQPSGGTGVEPVTPGLQSGFSPIWPLPGVGVGSITGHFGDMYFNGPHNGLDIGAGYGTPIVAAQAGEVISAQYHWSWGNNVLIWHNETFSTRYAHMSSIAVSAGQYVEQGQIIGYVGSTGESFGNHLHFEVYYGGSRVDPDPYLGI